MISIMVPVGSRKQASAITSVQLGLPDPWSNKNGILSGKARREPWPSAAPSV
jgi:hypothetical protein